MLSRLAPLLLILLLVGCEPIVTQSPPMKKPGPNEVFLSRAEPGYRLAPSDRERIPAGINADTLELLLSHIRPEYRSELLKSLGEMPRHGAIAFGPISSDITDPHIMALFRSLTRPHVPGPAEKPEN